MLSTEDRQAIDGLFERLEEAERRGGPRDVDAEAYIRSKIAGHPASPYYLAQTVVVQQEALKEAQRRIDALEQNGPKVVRQRGPWDREASSNGRGQSSGNVGFLAGAAQTALGVAGGVMLGSFIGSLFTSGAVNASEFDGQADTEPSTEESDIGSDDGGFDGGGFDMGGDF